MNNAASGIPDPLIVLKKLLMLFLMIASSTVKGQNDAALYFSQEEFLSAVRQFHPVVRQSENKVVMAKAGITAARAGFDPLFVQEMEEKKLSSDWYYQTRQQELILPTWYGVEIAAGKESIVGPRYNPERSSGTYSYLSVKIPLLKDLVLDKRRAALQQSKLFLQQSGEDQKNMVNDLINEAMQSYWSWVRYFEQWQLCRTVLENNKERFGFILQEYQQGFRPAIDTLEALVQWQQWQVQEFEAALLFNNAGIDLSAYLWKEGVLPYQLPELVRPAPLKTGNQAMFPVPVLEELVSSAKLSHPKLQMYKFKGLGLMVDRNLKRQELLPKLNIKSQLFQKGNPALAPVFQWPAWQNNHKFALELVVPLRFSAARAAYRQAVIKIADNELESSQLDRAIENKIRAYFNEYLSYQSQISIYENSVIAYEKLYRGEWSRFQAGESSLFLLNSREMKWMESKQKLVELQYKSNKSISSVYWAAGRLK